MDKSFNYLISPEISQLREFSPKLKIAILASGEGSNFQELIDLSNSNKFDIDIKILITNKSEAGCISRAKNSNISYKVIKSSNYENKDYFEDEIINTIKKQDIELVVMAGWMKIMSTRFVNEFKNKIINIHPSLLPNFPGLNAGKQALDAGVSETGCTVHYVDDGIDTGKIILQKKVLISKNDSIESLMEKIHKAEHSILIKALQKIIADH